MEMKPTLGVVTISQSDLVSRWSVRHFIMDRLRDAGLKIGHTLDPWPSADKTMKMILDAVKKAGGSELVVKRDPMENMEISWR